MRSRDGREVLDQIIREARHKIFIQRAGAMLIQAGIIVFPIATLMIGMNQRWNGGHWNWLIGLGAALLVLALAYVRGAWGLGGQVRAALDLDEHAHLQDRVSSAYEFLSEGPLDEPRESQVRDAIRHARALNTNAIYHFKFPKYASAFPAALLLFYLSFFIPPAIMAPVADATVDMVKELQLVQLEELENELAKDEETEEILEALEKLKDIKKQFEEGELSERDVMIELARLDEDMRQKAKEMGVENLEGELNTLVPHLMSSSAAREVANKIQENKMEEASEELVKLNEKLKNDELSEEEKRELALNMGVAASKLGGKQDGSFGGDLADASEGIESGDYPKINGAFDSISDKFGLVNKHRKIAGACKKLGLCKSSLGQCNSMVGGYVLGPKTQSKKKGGLRAGTGASGDPFGEADRLNESYRKVLAVSGQAGLGPVETETEVTEGQLSSSQVVLKDIHADFESVAEEAIENESIPLSHRHHVKRYFQSIRPRE